MTGMKSIEQPLITVAEALELSEHIKLSETCIAMELFDAFEKKHGSAEYSLWNLACSVTFVYDAGRVQGIREERAKRKRANAQNIAVNAF
ncbi:MAG: hypothetical protein SOT37_01480 [Oscillospiraceae bacterium]|nr:hypothetical protein [Oscillospiraceae bacterium]